jgi:transcriptional regulator with XRE-family HTH domain
MSTIGMPSSEEAEQPETGAVESGAETPSSTTTFGFEGPRLTDLGKQLEMLRVDRGVSKQALARAAGTSRQQLWRVMTGKSELTPTLCQRLASVLDVDSRTLSSSALGGSRSSATVTLAPARLHHDVPAPTSLASFLETPAAVLRTFRTLPSGDDGIPIKCAVLNTLEERARQARIPIPAWMFRVRASVLDGAL